MIRKQDSSTRTCLRTELAAFGGVLWCFLASEMWARGREGSYQPQDPPGTANMLRELVDKHGATGCSADKPPNEFGKDALEQ